MSMRTGFRSAVLILLAVAGVFLTATYADGREGTVSVIVTSGPYEIQNTSQGQEVRLEGFGRPDLSMHSVSSAVRKLPE